MRRYCLVFAAVAVAVAGCVGAGSSDTTEPQLESATTTILAPTSSLDTNPVATEYVQVEAAAPALVPLPLRFGELGDLERVLGTFTWTRVVGDFDALPLIWSYFPAGLAVEKDEEGNYVTWDYPLYGPPFDYKVWTSPDALTWTFEYSDVDTTPERFSRTNKPLMVEIPTGGFGLYEGLDNRWDGPLTDALISGDGRTWEVVNPSFVTENFKGAQVWQSEHQLEANVHTGQYHERWTSRNGVEWTRAYRYPAEALLVVETDIGIVAYGDGRYLVSIDGGNTWTDVPLPRGAVIYALGSGTQGAVDDFLFLRADIDEERIFLIGRFAND